MIDGSLDTFLAGDVMMVLAACDSEGRASIARGLGAIRRRRSAIDVLYSAEQWPGIAGGLQAGAPVAFTLCDPTDYRTYQIKGDVAELAPADSSDEARAERYCRQMKRVLMGLGVPASQADRWLSPCGIMRLSFRPRVAFHQTPGPNAGSPL